MDELVKRALTFEEKGQRFYEEMAKKSDNALARALFENLARDEERHARWIEDLRAALKQQGLDKCMSDDQFLPLESRVKEVFDRLESQAPSAEADTVEGLQVAMSMEKEALDLYREMLEQDPAVPERTFLERIMAEEWDHLEALRNVHAYLTQTGEWFDEDESRRWNWMNI